MAEFRLPARSSGAHKTTIPADRCGLSSCGRGWVVSGVVVAAPTLPAVVGRGRLRAAAGKPEDNRARLLVAPRDWAQWRPATGQPVVQAKAAALLVAPPVRKELAAAAARAAEETARAQEQPARAQEQPVLALPGAWARPGRVLARLLGRLRSAVRWSLGPTARLPKSWRLP